MQVILLERVAKLGQMGEVVKVRDGHARNFLLPQGKALRASDANIKAFEAQKADLEARNIEQRKDAEGLAKKLDGESFTMIRAAADSGALYGSVSTRDIAESVSEGGVTVTRNQVWLDKPIKALGLHGVSITLHPEVSATVTLNIARSPEEAEVQAAGKSIQDVAAEEEAAAQFEIDELFDDIGAAGEDDDLAPDDVANTDDAAR